ncbi:hypothetical protein B0H14DRAFT_2609547 [Mycena olivaceomarginata]|nr:hypothetical protein B0H14DRAFT_2609547 [Mycena olivaceomarginata]
MTSPNKPAIPLPFLPAKSTTSSWTGLGRRRQQQQQQRKSPIANATVNNRTEEEDKDDLYEEPPDDDLEDEGEEGEEEEEGEDGLEGEGVGEDGAAARAAGGQWFSFVAFNQGRARLHVCPTLILTVTDNLLKNNGHKFLEMMEQLICVGLHFQEALLNFDWPMKRRPWGVLVGMSTCRSRRCSRSSNSPCRLAACTSRLRTASALACLPSIPATARHPNAVWIPANASKHGHGVGAVGQFDPSMSTMLYCLPPTILSLPAAKYEYTEEGDKCTLALAP